MKITLEDLIDYFYMDIMESDIHKGMTPDLKSLYKISMKDFAKDKAKDFAKYFMIKE